MRINVPLALAAVAASSSVAVLAGSLTLNVPQIVSVASSPSAQCSVAAATYGNCIKAKYGACAGKTGDVLLSCMQQAAWSGTSCNYASLKACMSQACQQAVSDLQQCVQKLKNACTGKTGTALQTCLRETKATGCDPTAAQKCAETVKAKASSARANYSASSRSAASRSSAATRSWWQW